MFSSPTMRVYLHSFSRCCLLNLRNHAEFQENSNSAKVIDFGANQKRICDFLLVINSNSLDASPTVFETLTLKLEKGLFSPSTFVWRPIRGNPLEFLDETCPAKTRKEVGYSVGWKLHNPNSNRFDSPTRVIEWQTDRQTNGRTDVR